MTYLKSAFVIRNKINAFTRNSLLISTAEKVTQMLGWLKKTCWKSQLP